MAKQSYIILPEDYLTITVQEGDTGSVELTFPSFLSLTGARLLFQVWDISETRIFSYDETDMEISGQTVYVPLETTDTRGYPGKQSWEIQWINDSTVENVTAGKGDFIINPEGPK